VPIFSSWGAIVQVRCEKKLLAVAPGQSSITRRYPFSCCERAISLGNAMKFVGQKYGRESKILGRRKDQRHGVFAAFVLLLLLFFQPLLRHVFDGRPATLISPR
jgi:hypothetical protein